MGTTPESLQAAFNLSPWLLIVPLLTGILIVRKLPALITLVAAVVLACIAMAIAQPQLVAEIAGADTFSFASAFKGIVMTCYGPTAIETGSAALNDLVATRGMGGMMDTVWLILCAINRWALRLSASR